MPQSYNGGAPISHPHAIFQFWIPGGHLTAADHHGGGFSMASMSERDDHAREDSADHHQMTDRSPSTHALAKRSVRPDIPTISQVTPAAERSDMIGGILEPWFVLILALLAGLFVVRTPRAGLTPLPELPPPRLATTC